MPSSLEIRALGQGSHDRFESTRMRGAIAVRLFDRAAVTRMGRFVVGELRGRGGMGTVYAAWDPKLRRRVALKVLHGERSPAASERLRLEAQALAALSHPNIVEVYEIGDDDGTVFVVMELVEGESLAQWIARQSVFGRTRAGACLELLLQAGRGLAACHGAGLLHRDVKPGNVLVGIDGRARVADFGLVRAVDTDPAALDVDDTAARARDRVGTPAYMSPEQCDGRDADARSDQFSFCVMAWEALFGALPFEGDAEGRRAAVASGPPRAPRVRGVPRAVVAVLRRGLDEDPQRRHADMTTLSTQLEAATRSRRAGTIGIVLFAATLGLAWSSSEPAIAPAPGPCDAPTPMGTWWREQGSPTLADAAVHAGAATPALEAIDAAMLVYALRHDDAWRRACDDPEPAAREARLSCLRECQDEAAVVLDEFRDDPRTFVSQGSAAVAAMFDPELCAQAADAAGSVGRDAFHRAIMAELAAARAALRANRFAEAVVLDVAASARALAAGRPLLDARARLQLGATMLALGHPAIAGRVLEEAHALAEAAHDDHLAAEAAVLAMDTGDDASRRAWARHAAAALQRGGADPILEAAYLTRLGDAELDRGDDEAAEHAHARALELRRASGIDELATLENLSGLAAVAEMRGHRAEALARSQEVVELAERWLGREHPTVLRVRAELARSLVHVDPIAARAELEALLRTMPRVLGESAAPLAAVLGTLANLELMEGHLDAAAAASARAAAVITAALGEDSMLLVPHAYQQGAIALARGDLDTAERGFATALSLYERHDPHGPAVAGPLLGLAVTAGDRGDSERAIAMLERAASSLDGRGDDGRLGEVLYQLAAAHFDAGHVDRARAIVARARPLLEASYGEPSQRIAELLQLEGDIAAREGDLARAIEAHVRAEAMMLGVRPTRWAVVGYARARLAELRWDAGDRRGAHAAADAALVAYHAAEGTEARVAELSRWRAAHPRAGRADAP
jgi:tetratricopeptide (TPR) repeat protein